jgi:RimK family alpha-L-glutamate ligase
MNICVLTEPNGWHFLDLQRAAGEQHSITSHSFEDLSADVGKVHPLESYDAILARAMPGGSLPQIIFRMDVLLELERRGLPIFNPPRTIEASVDKYLTLCLLQKQGVPIPLTTVSQTMETALEQFEIFQSDVIVKPIFGSMGRGLNRIRTALEAEVCFSKQLQNGEVIYQQEFIEHGGTDFRLLVIGEEVLAMKRHHPSHWITNIAQGATGHPHQPTETEVELARDAAAAVGASIAGVDLVYDLKTGRPYVLEINSAPSWQTISAVLNLDVAKRVIEWVVGEVM